MQVQPAAVPPNATIAAVSKIPEKLKEFGAPAIPEPVKTIGDGGGLKGSLPDQPSPETLPAPKLGGRGGVLDLVA